MLNLAHALHAFPASTCFRTDFGMSIPAFNVDIRVLALQHSCVKLALSKSLGSIEFNSEGCRWNSYLVPIGRGKVVDVPHQMFSFGF